MDSINTIQSTQRALKLVNEVDDAAKHEGLDLLSHILEMKDVKLIEFGYDQVIMKELIKLAKFESGTLLRKTFSLLEMHYFSDHKHHDELMEALLYRYGLAGDIEVSKICLDNISSLVYHMDENVAKHSKQLLKLADLNTIVALNPIISDILVKIQAKLPKRRTQ